MSRPRVGRCCPDQEGNGVPVTTEQTVPSPFPNGRHCWSQNTELHAEVRGTSIQKKDSAALGSSGYQLGVPCKTFQCDQNCPFSVPILLPWTLCSLTKSLFPKTWAPFSKTLVISQASSPGPIRVTQELPLA